jgi:hypothetical protein
MVRNEFDRESPQRTASRRFSSAALLRLGELVQIQIQIYILALGDLHTQQGPRSPPHSHTNYLTSYRTPPPPRDRPPLLQGGSDICLSSASPACRHGSWCDALRVWPCARLHVALRCSGPTSSHLVLPGEKAGRGTHHLACARCPTAAAAIKTAAGCARMHIARPSLTRAR